MKIEQIKAKLIEVRDYLKGFAIDLMQMDPCDVSSTLEDVALDVDFILELVEEIGSER